MRQTDFRLALFSAALTATVCLGVQRHCYADLVAYWDFEEGSGSTATDSVSGNIGTLANGAAFSTDAPPVGGGYSLALDGVNDHVNVPDSASVSPTGSITLSAWVNAPSFAGAARNILAKESNSAYRWRINHDGQLWLLLNDGSGLQTYFSGAYAPTGGWHHTAVTVDFSDQTVRFYLDGALVSTQNTTETGIADTAGSLIIGAYNGAGVEGFNGNLDEVAMWSHALSGDQVKALANGITNPLNAAARIDGVTYTYSGTIQPHPNTDRNDPGNLKLTDSVVDPDTLGGTWVGFQDTPGNTRPQPQIDFDLGTPEMLGAIRIDYQARHSWAIFEPDSVVVEIYDDPGYTTLVDSFTATGFSDALISNSLTLGTGGGYAQYVRMKFYNDGMWAWLGEVTFFATIPEPGTFALAALGGVCLVGCGRRRRRRFAPLAHGDRPR